MLDGVVRLWNGSVALSFTVDISVWAWCIVMCQDGVVWKKIAIISKVDDLKITICPEITLIR
jgi:hypothetical protein